MGLMLLCAVFAKIKQSVTFRTAAEITYHSVLLSMLSYVNDNWYLSRLAKLSYSLASSRSPWVRAMARISISGTQADGMIFELSCAFIRSRILLGKDYVFQMELGENHIAWGEGYYYNAGDVIFGMSIIPPNSKMVHSCFL